MEKNITELSAGELSTMSVSQMLKLWTILTGRKAPHGQELWEKVEAIIKE